MDHKDVAESWETLYLSTEISYNIQANATA